MPNKLFVNPNMILNMGESLTFAVPIDEKIDFKHIDFSKEIINLLQLIHESDDIENVFDSEKKESNDLIEYLKKSHVLVSGTLYETLYSSSISWEGLRIIDYFNHKTHTSRWDKINNSEVITIENLFTKYEISAISRWFDITSFRKIDIDDVVTRYSKHWVHPFSNILEHVTYISVLKKIHDAINFIVPFDLELKEIKAYSTSYGDFATYHQDSIVDNSITAVIFVHEKWDKNWGGELIICDANQEPQIAVFPHPGKIVVFNGVLLHKAGVPTRICYETRKTIVLKYYFGRR